MTPKLYAHKCIKHRVKATMGEGDKSAHEERIIKRGAHDTIVERRTQVMRQTSQENYHIVRYPANEKHRHDAENQFHRPVFPVGPRSPDRRHDPHVAEAHD